MTASEVEDALTGRLSDFVSGPAVTVRLAHARGVDAVRGEHLVRPDGTIRLGPYGSVPVAGKTTAQVTAAVESHLRRFLDRPEVHVSVSAANSKAVAGLNTTRVAGEQAVELAWALVGTAHGRGLATEAALAAVAEARTLGLPEVVSFTLPGNVASRRVMEKAGLEFDRDITHGGLPHVLYRLRLTQA